MQGNDMHGNDKTAEYAAAEYAAAEYASPDTAVEYETDTAVYETDKAQGNGEAAQYMYAMPARRQMPGEEKKGFNPLKGGFSVDIINTFDEPDTATVRYWLFVAPYMCLGIAGFIALTLAVVDYWLARKIRELTKQPKNSSDDTSDDTHSEAA